MKKKIFSIVLCSMFLLSMDFMPVSASNHSDTPLTWNFSNGGGRQTATQRRKDNTTSVYQKCTSTKYSYTSYVIGAKTSTGAVTNASGGNSYVFNSGTVRYMINYVKEWGYSYAGLNARPSNSYTYNAAILWSPDSI